MKRLVPFGLILVVSVMSHGCSDSSPARSGASGRAAAVPTDPAAQTAHEFLSAMLEGDAERAARCLTPLALQRIRESGKSFVPQGLDSATFRIGEVRKRSAGEALVQCIVSDMGSDGKPRSEEMGCILKLVGDRWLVSGIGFQPRPDMPPIIEDFENPDRYQPTSPGSFAGPGQGTQPPTRTRPSTAQDPYQYPVR